MSPSWYYLQHIIASCMIYLIETQRYAATTCDLTGEQFEFFYKKCEEYVASHNANKGAELFSQQITLQFFENWSEADENLYKEACRKLDNPERKYWNFLSKIGNFFYPKPHQVRVFPETVLKSIPYLFAVKQYAYGHEKDDVLSFGDDAFSEQALLDHLLELAKGASEIFHHAEQNLQNKSTKRFSDGSEAEPVTSRDEPYFFQMRAATGVGVPGIIEAYEDSIEDSDGSPASVHDEKVLEAIKENTAILRELLPLMVPETDSDAKSSQKPTGLKVPGATINYNQVITQIYASRPETIMFTSDRLLALLKGLPGGENVTITADRIRQLPAWKKHRAIRESGKEQYWENMGNVTTEGKLAQKGRYSDD